MWIVVYADDLRITAHGPQKFEAILYVLFVLEMAGCPFSLRKTKGGLSQDWLGYWLDYTKFAVGVSEKRAHWLQKWLVSVTSGSPVLVRALSEGLGRLGYACGALEWGKPFLAPLYSWTSALPSGTYLPLPPMVRTTLLWLRDQLASGRRTSSARKVMPGGLLFKADAKGKADYVVLGGFECASSLMQSRWYSLKVTSSQAPWLFTKGHGSRTIATIEMLASLICIHCFARPKETPYSGRIVVTGVTDNLGNSYIVRKGMSTKCPVAPVLMQLVKELSDRQLWLDLSWAPREQNVTADNLTNGLFHEFDLRNRVDLQWEKLELVFKDLMKFVKLGESFYSELAEVKAAGKLRGPQRPRLIRARKVKTPW
jgi:hypothetical protein